MNTNETKVDVMAVMERAEDEQLHRFEVAFADEIRQARAAVAELIESDREYDEACQEWDDATGEGPEVLSDEEWRRVADRHESAIMRRIAALARIGGAA